MIVFFITIMESLLTCQKQNIANDINAYFPIPTPHFSSQSPIPFPNTQFLTFIYQNQIAFPGQVLNKLPNLTCVYIQLVYLVRFLLTCKFDIHVNYFYTTGILLNISIYTVFIYQNSKSNVLTVALPYSVVDSFPYITVFFSE